MLGSGSSHHDPTTMSRRQLSISLFGMITRATVDTAPRPSPYKLPIDSNSEILHVFRILYTHDV